MEVIMNALHNWDIFSVLIAYLLGAIPFSHLIARWRVGINIRERGEGNVGARNVYHVVGPAWGVLASLLDTGKGLAAYLVADRLALSPTAVPICGFAAPLGHNFSPFLRFRGGKGVATTMGFLLGFLPFSTLSGGLLVALVYFLTHDLNKALVLGMPGVILLPPVFGAPLWTVPYVLCLFLLLAVKKAIDMPHERAIWARDPWVRGRPGFHAESPEETSGEPVVRP
jgi:glycerol-3-phosphate acyltransferase PlsY